MLVTASANGNEFRFRDVGADVTRITPEGEVVISIIGQLPFGFIASPNRPRDSVVRRGVR